MSDFEISIKVIRTIQSCKTVEQLWNADKFCNLFLKKTQKSTYVNLFDDLLDKAFSNQLNKIADAITLP